MNIVSNGKGASKIISGASVRVYPFVESMDYLLVWVDAAKGI